MASADERAATGFFEHKGADGALIVVQATEGQVTVLQQSAGAFGRGAAQLTPDEADAIAAGITAAAKAARNEPAEDEPAAAEEPMVTETPAPDTQAATSEA